MDQTLTILEERRAVVAEAHTWLRTPWHHMGRVKGAGVDCCMILCEVYRAALPWCPEIEVPDYYPEDWHMHRDNELLLGVLEKYAERVEIPEPGDVVAFKFGRAFSHAAIVVQWPTIIHALVQARMVVLDDVTCNKELEPRVQRIYSPWKKQYGIL